MTMRDYRTEVEEDIIYHYMQQQQRKSQTVVSPVKVEQFYKENKDHFYQEDSASAARDPVHPRQRRDRRRLAPRRRPS